MMTTMIILMILTLIMMMTTMTILMLMIWTICQQDAGESGRCLKAAFPQTGLDIKMHSSFNVMVMILMVILMMFLMFFKVILMVMMILCRPALTSRCNRASLWWRWCDHDVDHDVEILTWNFWSVHLYKKKSRFFLQFVKISRLRIHFAIHGRFPPYNILLIIWQTTAL